MYTLPDGPTRDHLHHQFLSIYYFAMSAGALISTILTPILRTCVSYSAAFALPAALMMCSLLIFWSGGTVTLMGFLREMCLVKWEQW